MKTRNIVITIFVTPFLILMLLGVCLFFYAGFQETSSKAFDGKTVIPAESENFLVEEMIVRGPDTLFVFGIYKKSEKDPETGYYNFSGLPAVLRTYDGGKSWTKSVIRDWTALTRFYFMDDYAFLTSFEHSSDFEVVYAAGGDFSVWDSIGSYISLEGNRVHIARVNDSVPDGAPKYKIEKGSRVLPYDFVDNGVAIFAQNDKNWIIGAAKNSIIFYRVENGKAQQRLKTVYGKKENVAIYFEDFVVKDSVFAVVFRDGHPYDFASYYLFYSTDSGSSWKKERVVANQKIYRLDVKDGKIILVYCPMGVDTYINILTLSIE